MKLLAIAAALALATTTVFAQSGNMKGMEGKDMDMKGMDMKGMGGKSMSGSENEQSVNHASGVVRTVDHKAGTVLIAHGPVKTLNWSAITMRFKVKDKTLLDRLNVDKEVNFDFVKQGEDYVVTAVQ